ncbi:MAG: hypothetical protein ACRDTG_15470 [Pseudonocardiaceae bacterium]
MHSDEETHRGTLRACTVVGEPHSRQHGRFWSASPALVEWLALRRVPGGGIAQAESGNRWFQDGRLIVEWLQHPLDDLLTTQRITLAPPDPWELRHATITTSGWTRLAELTDANQSRIAVISPDFQPCSAAFLVVEESACERFQEEKA